MSDTASICLLLGSLPKLPPRADCQQNCQHQGVKEESEKSAREVLNSSRAVSDCAC
jgi:hypothetical protein